MINNSPLDRQLDTMDCGAACVKMVAKHYGKFYSLQYLRDLCGVTKEGVSLSDLSHAAEGIGQSYWVETISGIQDIKINNYEKQKRWKWEGIQARLYKVNLRVMSVTNTQNLGAQFIDQLKNLFITFYCFWCYGS